MDLDMSAIEDHPAAQVSIHLNIALVRADDNISNAPVFLPQ